LPNWKSLIEKPETIPPPVFLIFKFPISPFLGNFSPDLPSALLLVLFHVTNWANSGGPVHDLPP